MPRRSRDLRLPWTRAELAAADRRATASPPEDRLLAAAQKARADYTTRVELGVDLTPAEVEFGMAIERYKRRYQRPFPTAAEVLAVAESLGYRKHHE